MAQVTIPEFVIVPYTFVTTVFPSVLNVLPVLTVNVPLISAVAPVAKVRLTLVLNDKDEPLAMVKSVPELPPMVNAILVVAARVMVPCDMVSEL